MHSIHNVVIVYIYYDILSCENNLTLINVSKGKKGKKEKKEKKENIGKSLMREHKVA